MNRSDGGTLALAVQMLPGHLISGFVGIYGSDKPRVMLFPAPTATKLDLVYVQDCP
jgi:hypothetical protein